MDESQRSSMFEAWKKNEEEKQSKCEHEWNWISPFYCLKCGVFKENIK